MKLYGSYTSPFVRHCRVALAQENLTAEFVETDFSGASEKSPTAKVPFLHDGDLQLTDSSTIIKHIRAQSGNAFLADINDFETFMMANTILDSAVNVFLFANEGVDGEQVKYIARQQRRVASGLDALNARVNPSDAIATDGNLRCACLLAWGLYRERFKIDGLDNLRDLLNAAQADKIFAATAPPK